MRFDRRTLNLRSMKEKDAEELCFQAEAMSGAERERKTQWLRDMAKKSPDNINSKAILTIEEKNTKKVVGIIIADRAQYVMFATVIIPNEHNNILKYGYDAVDQFIKVCKEQCPNLKKVKLNKKNAAAKIYLDKNKADKNSCEFGYVSVV